MRCMLLCILEAVEGGLCLLEMLEVLEVIHCVLEAMMGGLRLLKMLEMLEMIRCVLLCMWRLWRADSFCWR